MELEDDELGWRCSDAYLRSLGMGDNALSLCRLEVGLVLGCCLVI